MKIEKLYVYPIKSFRGVEVDSATLTKHGFPYDRSFLVLQAVDENGAKSHKNMSVANFNEMVRFFPSFNFSKEGDESETTITITHKPLDGSKPKSIDIPLTPDVSNLEEIDIVMHLSATKAYRMEDKYNEWLSSCFGYDCILAYISDNLREVRMSAGKHKESTNGSNGSSNGWLSSFTSKATEFIMGSGPEEVNGIRFSDVAPYLFVSRKSMEDIDHRLPDGEAFDITKFRPNVIVSGADKPWDEDFWGELTIGEHAKVEVEHNCGRCRSINIDYDTGAQGTGEAGKMLKKLSSDRRVDKGTKWSPIFGRYAFLHADSEGSEIRVGEEVKVTRYNKERSAFGMFISCESLESDSADEVRRLERTIHTPGRRPRLIYFTSYDCVTQTPFRTFEELSALQAFH